jgi:GH25 family lysozyme M1 (1,4-beta-N-acetylmuramidase)
MGIKYSSFQIRGIDVSTFNGVIDWTDMPARFAGIRVGYGQICKGSSATELIILM